MLKIAYELPARVVTNDELAALYDGWTPEKILSKTGIASRHVAAADETAGDLAVRAAEKLFASGVRRDAVDFILFCSQSPDYKLPSTACLIQDRLHLPKGVGALDYDLGCSGFVYGLSLAKGLVAGGIAKGVLLLTAETYSKYIHPLDKSVRTIFGDGAAATFVDGAAAASIGAFSFGTDGSGAEKLIVRTGGARAPLVDAEGRLRSAVPADAAVADASGNVRGANNIFMAGPDIFNFTLDIVPKTMDDVCAKNGLTRDDIDLFVFHQANKFMLDTLRKVNGLPRDRFVVDLADVGNTVSSTIPIALVRAAEKGVLRSGMKTMVMGFGVGLSWGATIVGW